jgi:transposase InsO family protein
MKQYKNTVNTNTDITKTPTHTHTHTLHNEEVCDLYSQTIFGWSNGEE